MEQDHEATETNLISLLKKIPGVQIDIGDNSFLIYSEKEEKIQISTPDTLTLN